MRFLLLTALLATAASAQPGWRAVPTGGPVVTLDALYALGDDIPFTSAESPEPGDDVLGVQSWAVVLGARVPVVGRLAVVGELPVAGVAYDYPEVGSGRDVPGVEFGTSDVALGNPYVGAEWAAGPALAVAGGVRLPLVTMGNEFDAHGWEGGLRADAERFEAYQPDLLTVSAAVRYTPALGERARARLRLEPALLVPSDDDRDADPDLVLGGGLGADVAVGAATLSGGLLGRYIVTDGHFGASDLFDVDAVAVLGASVEVGGVRPGLDLRVPLYDPVFGQDAAVGLRLDVPLR